MVPGPPEIFPRRPEAIVDLQTDAGAALVGAQWRYSDARVEEIAFVALAGAGAADPLGPGDEPNRTYDVQPHAEAADYDDSDWELLAPEETMDRLADGRVCFNWYRVEVTIPERVGGFDPTGSTVIFEVVVDDYAEVWVNGELPLVLGMTGGQAVAGFNAPNRVVLTDDARPGDRFQIAVFGINGPISGSPRNYIWMRTATLEFHAPAPPRPELDRVAGGFEFTEGPVWSPEGALLFSSPNTGAIYRLDPRLGQVTLFRPKSSASGLAFSPEGLLTISQPERVIQVNPHGDVTPLADRLDDPHDLVYRSDGMLFFTDGAVFCLRDGDVRLVTDNLVEPTGLALSPDERRLYVAHANGITSYDFAAGGGQLVYRGEAIGGLAVARDGTLYACTREGVQVISAAGEKLERIELPEAPHNLAWGDADGRSLYITATTSIYRLRREP
jgi:gluconolactonase